MILQRWGWIREKAFLKRVPGFQIYTNREDFSCIDKKGEDSWEEVGFGEKDGKCVLKLAV